MAGDHYEGTRWTTPEGRMRPRWAGALLGSAILAPGFGTLAGYGIGRAIEARKKKKVPDAIKAKANQKYWTGSV